MTSFLVIGLNALGRSLGRELYQRSHKVTLIDISEERVNRMCHEIPHVMQVDSTERAALEGLGIDKFDHIIVCMGHRFEVAERTTLALKDLGAKSITNVATTEVRASILTKIGANRVVTPGLELAKNLAVVLGDSRIQSFTYTGPKVGVAEIMLPEPLTLPETWRALLGECNVVIGVKRKDQGREALTSEVTNLAGVVLEVGDRLLVFGDPDVMTAKLDKVF